jgi:membrane-bound metal-dependent hydrolase YbcI (DUF457 family)
MGLLAGALGASASHMPPGQAALFILATSGGALASDLDTGRSTAALTFGPITRSLARFVADVSGGHREGTHWLLGAPPIFGGIGWLALAGRHLTINGALPWVHNVQVGKILFIGLLAFLIGAALRALKLEAFKRGESVIGLANFGMSIGLALLAYRYLDVSTVPLAIALGVAVHIAGDMLTEDGCPVFTPHGKKYGLKIFDTGEWFERRVLTPALAIPALWIAADRAAPAHAVAIHFWLIAAALVVAVLALISWTLNKIETRRQRRCSRRRRTRRTA